MTPEQLKASILQYAIQGKLIEQRPEEGTGEELYQQIVKNRELLIERKVIKRDKRTETAIDPNAIPFDVPENWKWVTLGSILNKLTDGTHKTPKYTTDGIKFVSVKDMSNGVLSLENTKFISEEEHQELYARCNPEKGDILLSKVGTTGVPAIVNTTEQFSIQTEKRRLIKEGKIKKEKPLAEITEDEKPYDIPDNWTWVRFGDLGSYKKGPFGSAITKSMFVPKGNGAIKVYEQKNAIQKDATLGDYYIRRDYFESKMKGFEVFPGDIIVSCAGTIGETYVMPDEFEQGIINQALMRMKIFEPLYIPYFLTFFDFVLKKNARSSSKGSAIKNIPPFEILKNYLVPIPPLAEQKRIVAKLEEILPLCERLK